MSNTWSACRKFQDDVVELFEQLGAIEKGHFVYASGKHGSVYVAKDLVIPSTRAVFDLTEVMAEEFLDEDIDTVIGIAPIGAILAHHLAERIQENTGRPTYAIFAEKGSNKSFAEKVTDVLNDEVAALHVREPLQRFIDDSQRILVVEDILNTGGSAKKLVQLVRSLGAQDVWGVTALWNRGGVIAADLGVQQLFSLCDVEYTAWDEADCPLCREGVPINTNLGHGKAYLAAHS